MVDAGDIDAFLKTHKWDKARRVSFPADWSQRSYVRLVGENGPPASAILMIAPPDHAFRMFQRVDALLRQSGASAPEIYAVDPVRGLMVLEDFGDRNFGRLIDQGHDPAPFLRRAIDVLIALRRHVRPEDARDLPVFDTARFLDLLTPFIDDYMPAITGAAVADDARGAFFDAWRDALGQAGHIPQGLVLRDFMADNLMDLPEREGWHSVGLLDFELAGTGPVAYDFASLTEQVRRDLDPALCRDLADRYLAAFPDLERASFLRAVAVLSAQRHCRILAVLHKVAQIPAQSHKASFFPRLWRHMARVLEKPELHPVKRWMDLYCPSDIRSLA